MMIIRRSLLGLTVAGAGILAACGGGGGDVSACLAHEPNDTAALKTPIPSSPDFESAVCGPFDKDFTIPPQNVLADSVVTCSAPVLITYFDEGNPDGDDVCEPGNPVEYDNVFFDDTWVFQATDGSDPVTQYTVSISIEA